MATAAIELFHTKDHFQDDQDDRDDDEIEYFWDEKNGKYFYCVQEGNEYEYVYCESDHMIYQMMKEFDENQMVDENEENFDGLEKEKEEEEKEEKEEEEEEEEKEKEEEEEEKEGGGMEKKRNEEENSFLEDIADEYEDTSEEEENDDDDEVGLIWDDEEKKWVEEEDDEEVDILKVENENDVKKEVKDYDEIEMKKKYGNDDEKENPVDINPGNSMIRKNMDTDDEFVEFHTNNGDERISVDEQRRLFNVRERDNTITPGCIDETIKRKHSSEDVIDETDVMLISNEGIVKLDQENVKFDDEEVIENTEELDEIPLPPPGFDCVYDDIDGVPPPPMEIKSEFDILKEKLPQRKSKFQLKRIRYEPINEESYAETMWMDWIKNGFEPEVDYTRLEELFAKKKTPTKGKKKKMNEKNQKEDDEVAILEAELLPLNRQLVVNGFVKRLKFTVKGGSDEKKKINYIIDQILEMSLDKDEVKTLKVIAPAEEVVKFKKVKKYKKKVSPCCLFMYKLSKMERLTERLNTWCTKITFHEDVDSYLPIFNNVVRMCDILLKSDPWKEFLQLVLTIFNFLNDKKHQELGFQMKYLELLENTKSNFSITLLQYVIELIGEKKTEEWKNQLMAVLKEFEVFSIKEICADYKLFKKRFKKIKNEIEKRRKGKTNKKDKYCAIMKKFLDKKTTKDAYRIIEKSYVQMEKSLEEIAVAFGEDKKKFVSDPSEFFAHLKKFRTSYIELHDHIYKQKTKSEALIKKKKVMNELKKVQSKKNLLNGTRYGTPEKKFPKTFKRLLSKNDSQKIAEQFEKDKELKESQEKIDNEFEISEQNVKSKECCKERIAKQGVRLPDFSGIAKRNKKSPDIPSKKPSFRKKITLGKRQKKQPNIPSSSKN